MKSFRLNPAINDCHAPGAVLAIGNFDGVHLGHQQVIAEARRKAMENNTIVSVMTFEPYPREFFQGSEAPPRLTGLRKKLELMQQADVDCAHYLRFNSKLANTTAEDFIQHYLVDTLKVSHVIVGKDFRFGRNRKGDIALLSEQGRKLGFGVTAIEDFIADGDRISSSLIRELLKNGDLEQARELLGRSVFHVGRVLHGDKRGRQWGFPTANLRFSRQSAPLRGVFVVEVNDRKGWIRHGVANLGKRPTVDGLKLLLEVHLFDCESDLYGKLLEVHFLYKVRDEKKFDSFDDLKAQIGRDAEVSRQWLLDRSIVSGCSAVGAL